MQTATARGHRAGARGAGERRAGARVRQRDLQRGAGQPVPAGHPVSRLCGVSAPRAAAGHRRVPGRRPRQRALWRHGQLGSASDERHRQHQPDARVESAVRPERARRRTVGADQDRRHASGARRERVRRFVRPRVDRPLERRPDRPERRPVVLCRRAAARRRRVAGLLRVAHQAVLRQHRVAGRCHHGRRVGHGRRQSPDRQRPGAGAAPRRGSRGHLHASRRDQDRASASSRSRPVIRSAPTSCSTSSSRTGPPRCARSTATTPPYEPCDDDDVDHLLCVEGDDDPIHDQFGQVVPVPATAYDGTSNTSRTSSQGWGTGLQATLSRPFGTRANSLIAGGSFDGAGSDYEADTELARLDDTRGAQGAGIFDGDASVRLKTTVRNAGLYAADFFSVTPRLTLSGSARLTHSTVELRDQIGDDLNGDHTFTRLNPAAGATFQLPRGVSAYGSYSVSSRVPTPSELSCADPEDPCRLPNAFVADPPLDQVVADTWEGGLRGRTGRASWFASVFRTANRDDILFISSGALTNEGHFENVGDTLRRGVELGASGQWTPRLGWTAVVHLPARDIRDTADAQQPQSSGRRRRRDRRGAPASTLPGVPRHNLKAGLFYRRRPLVGGREPARQLVAVPARRRSQPARSGRRLRHGRSALPATRSAAASGCRHASRTCSMPGSRPSAFSARPTKCWATTTTIRASSAPARLVRRGSAWSGRCLSGLRAPGFGLQGLRPSG